MEIYKLNVCVEYSLTCRHIGCRRLFMNICMVVLCMMFTALKTCIELTRQTVALINYNAWLKYIATVIEKDK